MGGGDTQCHRYRGHSTPSVTCMCVEGVAIYTQCHNYIETVHPGYRDLSHYTNITCTEATD